MKLVLLLSILLQADPNPRLDEIVRRLGSEDPAERSRAQEELRKAVQETPEQFLEPLKARRAKASDQEVKSSLESVIRPIEAGIRWRHLWTTNPSELADVHVKKTPCPGCNNPTPWAVTELTQELLAKYVPDCKFFLLRWRCCQDRPVASRILVLSKQPETLFEIQGTNEPWKGKLMPHLKPAITQDEALQIGALVVGLWCFKEAFDENVKTLGGSGRVEKVGGAFKAIFSAETEDYFHEWWVEFDSEGRLSGGSVQAGPKGSPGRGGALR